jgi:hypothetical protein
MNEYWELHECDQLPPKGIQILFSMDEADRKAKTWRLIIRREATNDDLMENHILEEEGQTLWETYLEITHCPFCGKSLYNKPPTEFKDYGQFVHYDRSEWTSKRQ